MAVKIQLRRDTAANWAAINPIPAESEPCHEIDTNILKFGDGVTNYNDLPAFGGGASVTPSDTTPPVVNSTFWLDTTDMSLYVGYDNAWVGIGGGGSLSATAFAQTLLDDADAEAARLTLGLDDSQLNKLSTIQEGATASPSVRYATKAGTVTNANVIVRGMGPSTAQTLELQYVPHDSTPTLLATLTIPTTPGIIACPVFSQALRVVTNGSGSITAADGIQAIITSGPSLPPPVVTFS